jgi:hypothetical protein
MKKYNLSTALGIVLVCASSAAAVSIGYGAGTMRVSSALVIPKGNLYLGGHSRAFFKDEVAKSSQGLSSGQTYWDIQSGLGFRYGFTSKLELGITQIIYQDNHKGGKGYNFPDDLYLSAKLGSIGPRTGILRLGVQADVRLPLAKHHNLALEPYSAGRIGMGGTAILTFISQPLYPGRGVHFNVNAGIFSYNDLGIKLTKSSQDTLVVRQDTQEIIYGLSLCKFNQEFGFFTEVYGRSFLHKPPVSALTRESSFYVTPGISYNPNPWLRLRVALDIRLIGKKDETSYNGDGGSLTPKIWKTVPNLPTWQINLAAVVALHAPKHSASVQRVPGREQIATSSSAPVSEKLYQDMADTRQQTENAEAELERIRSERQRMEDLLQRLRKILEWPAAGTAQPTEQPKEEKPKE